MIARQHWGFIHGLEQFFPQWHLIPSSRRAGRRWQMVWQGPRLGFVAETGRFVAMETPWVRFSCLLAFVPCFLLFVFRFSFLSFLNFFPSSRYVYVLRVPSSVQQPSATLSKCVFYSTCSFCLWKQSKHSYTRALRGGPLWRPAASLVGCMRCQVL